MKRAHAAVGLARGDGCGLVADAHGVFEGYASVFEREDQGRDVVQRGAFAASLARRGAGGVKMLFQHDPNQPIGRWLDLKEDARGLYVRGQLLSGVPKAHEVLTLMRAGVLDGLSIGFKVVRARRDRARSLRRLEVVDLWEISVVTFPMLDVARVSNVKRHKRRSARIKALLQPPKRDSMGGYLWCAANRGVPQFSQGTVKREGRGSTDA